MDSKVKYAIMGGVALAGAAAVYLFYSKSDEGENVLEDELDQLGALELDANGVIEF
jgi:hypothetical protein